MKISNKHTPNPETIAIFQIYAVLQKQFKVIFNHQLHCRLLEKRYRGKNTTVGSEAVKLYLRKYNCCNMECLGLINHLLHSKLPQFKQLVQKKLHIYTLDNFISFVCDIVIYTIEDWAKELGKLSVILPPNDYNYYKQELIDSGKTIQAMLENLK